MRTGVASVRRLAAARVIVAAPLGAREVCRRAQLGADEVICLHMPEPLVAVGLWYEEFVQTSDEEVTSLLQIAATLA